MRRLIICALLVGSALLASAQEATLVRVPPSVVGVNARSNVVNGLVDWLNLNTTNRVGTNAMAFAAWYDFIHAQTANTNGVAPTNTPTPGQMVYASGPASSFWGDAPAGNGTNTIVSSNLVNKLGAQVYPASNGTNFWWDYGLTNEGGQVVYQTIVATNNVWFLGTTNLKKWDLLSMNVIASGGNRLIDVPTNLPHINTNGFTIGSTYRLTLTNGNEFRLTIQSNASLSTIWTTFGQGFAGATATSTGSVIQSVYTYPPGTDFTDRMSASGTYVVSWTNGDNHILRVAGGGSTDFQISDWQATSPSQIETHRFIIANTGVSMALTFSPSNNWVWVSESGVAAAPTFIGTTNIWIFTITHIGGETNWLVHTVNVTNPEAIHF